jgi:hypothetical protein
MNSVNIPPGILGVGCGVGRVWPLGSGTNVVCSPGAGVIVPVISPVVPLNSQYGFLQHGLR